MMTPEERVQEMMDRYKRSMNNTTDGPKTSAIVCPKYYGKEKECVLCDLTRTYFMAKLGKEHFLRSKALNYNRKLNYYSNVVFATNPSEIVIFQYGEEIFKTLFGYASDKNSDYIGFAHPKTGRNFVVKKEVPAGNKRQTKYSIEMRSTPSLLADPSVIQKQPNLDNVLDIIEKKQFRVVSQRDLQEGRTEMRILPSWLGPKYDIIFATMVPIHFINKDEFDAIQAGKVNPYAEAGIKLATQQQPAPIIIQPEQVAAGSNSWGAWETPEVKHEPPQIPPEAPQKQTVNPPCYGTYDATSPLCTEGCLKQGFDVEGCSKASTQSAQDQNAELRKVASKLYR